MYYNLEERTAKFGEEIIRFSKMIPKNVVTLPIISQLVRAGTSVGANYCEAIGASSKKDFKNKMRWLQNSLLPERPRRNVGGVEG